MKPTVKYRAVFNIAIAIEDDHSRNHAFLMDAIGEWKLSPAYDMTRTGYALGTGFRAAGVLGKYSKLGLSDLKALASTQGIRKPNEQIDQVLDAVGKWPDFAENAGLRATEISLLKDEFPSKLW
jgi:serine/threonine-protein kinase HipA